MIHKLFSKMVFLSISIIPKRTLFLSLNYKLTYFLPKGLVQHIPDSKVKPSYPYHATRNHLLYVSFSEYSPLNPHAFTSPFCRLDTEKAFAKHRTLLREGNTKPHFFLILRYGLDGSLLLNIGKSLLLRLCRALNSFVFPN